MSPNKTWPVEHVDSKGSHGPVTIFVADDGEIVLVCEQDQRAWRLKHRAVPIADSAGDGDEARDSLELSGVTDTRRRIDSRALAMRAFRTD